MNAADKERMIAAGYDLNGALARFVNNEVLFLTFLKKFPNDEHFPAVLSNIKTGEYDEAYKAAHAIKGVAGNLGLTPVFESVDKICALIKTKDEVSDFETKIMETYEAFEKAFNESGVIINAIE